MEQKRFGVVEFSLGLALGVAAGAALALLMTPVSGSEARGQIAKGASGVKMTVIDMIDQARYYVDLAAKQAEKVVGLQERNLRKKLDEIKTQLEEYHLNEV